MLQLKREAMTAKLAPGDGQRCLPRDCNRRSINVGFITRIFFVTHPSAHAKLLQDCAN